MKHSFYTSIILLVIALPFSHFSQSVSNLLADECYPSTSNLALNRPAYASSVERGGLEPDKAVDGNLLTRWSSQQGTQSEWFYVDLGEVKNVEQVILRWEGPAYSESYNIDFSNDSTNWITVSTQGAMNEGDHVISVSGVSRYVRFFGLHRGHSGFGHSLWEFEVYDHEVCEVPPPQVRPPTPIPGPNTLFFDDFEDGADPAWSFISGNWDVIDGYLETETACAQGLLSSAVIGDSSWMDYEVQFDFRGDGGSVKQFQFRHEGSSHANRYLWQARSLENDVGLSGGGFPETLTPHQIQQGVWYRVRIRAVGEHIQIFVDDELVVDRIDIGTTRLAGGVGPFLGSGTVNCPFRVQYDNVIVNQIVSRTDTLTPTPTDTPTATPTSTATPTPSPTATSTPTPTIAHIGDLDGIASFTGPKWIASITIKVHNFDHNLLANATVNGLWSGGYTGPATCMTNETGQCVVISGSIPKGKRSVTFTITGVTISGYSYQPAANHDADSNGTIITVNRP
jgi:hypothetical protein